MDCSIHRVKKVIITFCRSNKNRWIELTFETEYERGESVTLFLSKEIPDQWPLKVLQDAIDEGRELTPTRESAE